MSYMSGFMLGASVGKLICQQFFCQQAQSHFPEETGQNMPAAESTLIRVHAIPHRRRYISCLLRENERLAQLLETLLPKLDCIDKATVNVVTGSLLIYYGREKEMNLVEDALQERLFLLTQREEYNITAKANQKMIEKARELNRYIEDATAHLIDVKSLLSIIFIVTGMKKTVFLGQRPSGPQMLWWAYGLLRERGAV